jgi:excisionase family DNA binding protein
MEKLLTPKQLSEILQVSRGVIYKWIYMGFIPHYKLGGQVRFKERDIEAWLNKRKRKGRTTYRLNIEELGL